MNINRSDYEEGGDNVDCCSRKLPVIPKPMRQIRLDRRSRMPETPKRNPHGYLTAGLHLLIGSRPLSLSNRLTCLRSR